MGMGLGEKVPGGTRLGLDMKSGSPCLFRGPPARLVSSRSGVCFIFFLRLVAWTGTAGWSFLFLLLLSTSTGLKMGISVILGGSSTGMKARGGNGAGF